MRPVKAGERRGRPTLNGTVLTGHIAPDHLNHCQSAKDQPCHQDKDANDAKPVHRGIIRIMIGPEASTQEAADDQPWKFQKAHADSPFTLEKL